MDARHDNEISLEVALQRCMEDFKVRKTNEISADHMDKKNRGTGPRVGAIAMRDEAIRARAHERTPFIAFAKFENYVVQIVRLGQ